MRDKQLKEMGEMKGRKDIKIGLQHSEGKMYECE